MKNPLDFECPTCGAQPGVRCRNYNGQRCAPHSARNAKARGIAPSKKEAPGLQLAILPTDPTNDEIGDFINNLLGKK